MIETFAWEILIWMTSWVGTWIAIVLTDFWILDCQFLTSSLLSSLVILTWTLSWLCPRPRLIWSDSYL